MIYRNFVKALPWYTLVREKITDPEYKDWFLPFGPPTVGNGWHVPQCDTNYNPPLCTQLYHDQGQTPGDLFLSLSSWTYLSFFLSS
jgi:hypothetical protein